MRRRKLPGGLTKCPKCGLGQRPQSGRCLKCGYRFRSAGPDLPAHRAVRRAELEDDGPLSRLARELTEIQKRILAASMEGRQPIYVSGATAHSEAQVCSGSRRFNGNAAVVAIAGLVAPGLITEAGKDCFELTENGQRVAASLSRRES